MSAIIASMTPECMVKEHEESNHRSDRDLERRQEAYKLNLGAIQERLLFYETEKYANKYCVYIAFIITTITCKMIRYICWYDEKRDWFLYTRRINFVRLLFIIPFLYKEINMHILYAICI